MAERFRRARAIRMLIESYGLPGEETARKLDVVAAAQRLLRDDLGGTPDWVVELRNDVEEGRL